jgi:hypothetical protein
MEVRAVHILRVPIPLAFGLKCWYAVSDWERGDGTIPRRPII